jgi:hypothetical protein
LQLYHALLDPAAGKGFFCTGTRLPYFLPFMKVMNKGMSLAKWKMRGVFKKWGMYPQNFLMKMNTMGWYV